MMSETVSTADETTASRSRPLDEVLLVPGFMSQRWSLWLMFCYLKSRFPSATAWDYPQVFTDIETTIDRLAELIDSKTSDGRTLGLVTHSFGDWVARAALAKAGNRGVRKVVSIAPVVTAVPVARMLHKLTGARVPELRIMADEQQASAAPHLDPFIDHLVLWAKWEWLVVRPDDWPNEYSLHETKAGTHVSLVFQPRIWRRVAQHLRFHDAALESS